MDMSIVPDANVNIPNSKFDATRQHHHHPSSSIQHLRTFAILPPQSKLSLLLFQTSIPTDASTAAPQEPRADCHQMAPSHRSTQRRELNIRQESIMSGQANPAHTGAHTSTASQCLPTLCARAKCIHVLTQSRIESHELQD